MKAFQKIIFSLSMAIALVLCQEVVAEETQPFVSAEGMQKMEANAQNKDEFNKKLAEYNKLASKKKEESEKKRDEAEDIFDDVKEFWSDFLNTVATRGGQGAIAGTVMGSAFAGVGAAPGAVAGTATGVTFGVIETFINNFSFDDYVKDMAADVLGGEVLRANSKAGELRTKCYALAESDPEKTEKCHKLSKVLTEYVQSMKDWKDADMLSEQYSNALGYGLENLYYILSCYTDAKGEEQCTPVYFNKTCTTEEGGKEECTYTQKIGVAEGCTPLPIKLAETRTCLFCPLFKVIYDAANTMATSSYSTLGRPMALIMLVGLAIFIAFKVMVLTSGFVKQDAPKFISEALTQIFKVLVAYLLLYNAGAIYIYAVSPVLSAGLEFGTAIMGGEYSKYLKDCATSNIGSSTGILPASLYARLDCFIRAVQQEIAIPQSMGTSLVCISLRRGADLQYILPDFSMLFVGVIIWAFSWLVMLAFGFYLIDATIRIGIVGALMPFLIATWPFKPTAKYATTGWGMLLNTFFVYVFLGIVIAVNVTLMFVSIGGADGQVELNRLINGNSLQDIKDKLDIGFSGFIVLIIGCLFGFKLTSQSSALAGSFAGGAGPDLAPKIGGLMASGATGAGKWTAGKTLKGGKRVFESIGGGQKLRGARDWARGTAKKAVSSIFGGGDPSKSSKKPSGGGAGGSFTNTNQGQQGIPPQQGDNTQQQGSQGTPPTGAPNTPPSGAPQGTPSGAPQGGSPSQGENFSPQDDVNNAVNAGPRGSEQQTQQQASQNLNSPENIAKQENLSKESLARYAESKQRKNNYDERVRSSEKKSQNAWNEYQNRPSDVSKDEEARMVRNRDFEDENLLRQQKGAGEADNNMHKNATEAYVNLKKSEAMSQGKSFNEQETTAYAYENFDEVLKELDSSIAQDE